MPRPKKCRKVCRLPKNNLFVPACSTNDEIVFMSVEEYETIRLIDKEGFSQEECSSYMKIARTTAQQIYLTARKKIAHALVEGTSIKIEGGDYALCEGKEMHCACGGCCKHSIALENIK